jgi:hypothetical protein
MAAYGEYPRVTRLLPFIAGGVLIAGAFLLDIIAETGLPQSFLSVLVVFGCALVVLGIVSRNRRLNSALANASLAVLSIVISSAVLEATFRFVGFDFNRLHQPGDDVPIYYRTPLDCCVTSIRTAEWLVGRPVNLPRIWARSVLTSTSGSSIPFRLYAVPRNPDRFPTIWWATIISASRERASSRRSSPSR